MMKPDLMKLRTLQNFLTKLCKMMAYKNFNVLTEPLEGQKLIEASAGTGKTYSVAILVIRLILDEDKDLTIDKILMVTFTKAAVAELESRIRKFVRLAYKYASGQEIGDENIKQVVGKTNEKKKNRLKKAVQNLDILSVMTIHSFCQQTINEFTFETNQSFDYEIITDDSDLLKNASNIYIREVLNRMDLDKFRQLKSELKFGKMHELLRKHLQGMKFIDSDLNIELSDVEKNKQNKYQALKNEVDTKFQIIKDVKINGNTDLAKNRKSADMFLPVFIKSCCENKKYISEFEFLYYPYGKEYADACSVENIIYLNFFKKSEERIKAIKQSKGYISYDDQIKTIHSALQNLAFREKLAEKYKAVFIDEFQDTDKYQYEIFDTVFSGKSLMFFIGDPKQSIYSWRSADLDTYKAARQKVGENCCTMGVNYRSTKPMLEAVELLLKCDDAYNVFLDDEIKFEQVKPGSDNPGKITNNEEEVPPITIWEFDNNDHSKNYKAVAKEVFRLLTNQNIRINNKSIKPNDIGILIRTNREGDEIKKELANLNIPAVKRDEVKVLESDESRMIQYLLIAVITSGRGNINRALLTPYFGFTAETIKTLHDEKHIEEFIGLKKVLYNEGIYNMISSFLIKYGVRSICMGTIAGQRVLTNINHIAEILNKVEKQSKYTPDELLVWMQRNAEDGNEEYQQRIENDENAVQISTIHKAKGLEYNIVFAPGLCMIPNFKKLEKNKVNDFKKNAEYYFTFNYGSLNEEDKKLHDTQKEQENRRLIYVALTRSVYKSYISYMPRSYIRKPKVSSFEDIYNRFKPKCSHNKLFEIADLSGGVFVNEKGKYVPADAENIVFTPRPSPKIEIKSSFGIHSYSALSKAHFTAPFEKAELGDEKNYDQFIFQTLGRGANTGTALHSIFEHLDFSNVDTWKETLQDASKYYSGIIKEDYLDLFKQLISHAMNAEIECGEEKFKLKDIKKEQKLPEMEFLFSLDKVKKSDLNKRLGEEAELAGEADIEGLMTGFIDLVFEHKEKYYILDWKSNHLGNTTENYKREGTEEAMKGSNYNLQYMIYTIAVKRWLENKKQDFDYDKHFGGVIYVFLRGVRMEKNTGIYATRPEKSKIEALESILYTTQQHT